jgi:hypothetical protein
MGGGMGAGRAPMMGAARAPTGAAHPAMGASRFGAPAQRAAGPAYAAHPGHFATPAGGHFGAAGGHAGGGHFAATQAHAGMHAEGRGFGREAGREEAGRGEAGRGEAGHAGREEIGRDDPARAHGRFDEHVRNPERERDIARMHGHDFHVRDVRYFNEHEWGRWRGGYWHRDYYDGRFGWWFDVGGVYYPYEAPIWPYPLYVAPLIVAETAYAAPPPPPIPIAPLPALPHVAYHCASPAGFYPEVAACDAGWMTIAAH